MRKEQQAKRKQSNLVSTSSSPRVPSSACGASGFWGGIWTAAGGSCTTRGSCCGGGFSWFCWTGSTSGWGNWTSGMTSSGGACNKDKGFPFPTASLKKRSKKDCSTPIWYLLATDVISLVLVHPYGVLLWSIVIPHLITSVMNSAPILILHHLQSNYQLMANIPYVIDMFRITAIHTLIIHCSGKHLLNIQIWFWCEIQNKKN